MLAENRACSTFLNTGTKVWYQSYGTLTSFLAPALWYQFLVTETGQFVMALRMAWLQK